MGCDIHIYVEKKENGRWVSADTWKKDSDFNYVHPQVYEGRCYDLFAILADVRNGRGFAGVKTGEGFNPISEPKGLPEDVSPEVLSASDGYGIDGHSHSHHTLRELLDYDWTQKTSKQGYVSLEEYKKLKRITDAGFTAYPESWCGGISGAGVHLYDTKRADELIAQNELPKEGSHHVAYQWGVTYAYAAGPNWWNETMVKLLAMAKGDYDSVRIVFWFDN